MIIMRWNYILIMNQKSNGHPRSSLPAKNKPNLERVEVSVDKLRYKASKTMASTDIPRNAKSKDENSHNKSKEKFKPNIKPNKQKPKSKPKRKDGKLRGKRSCDANIVRNGDETYNNTDRRKSSLKKHHQTEVCQEYFEPESELIRLQIELLKVPKPKEQLQQISKYYEEILKIVNDVEESRLHELLTNLHKAYTTPALEIFELVEPYQSLLLKRREITFQVQQQFERNRQLFEQMNQSSQSEEIDRLHQIVETQRKEIEELQVQRQHSLMKLETIMFQDSNKDLFKKKLLRRPKNIQQPHPQEQPQPQKQLQPHLKSIQDLRSPKQVQLGKQLKDFKIDLSALRNSKPIGYHQQFMSKLPQMSQSWRQQALRQKRF